MWRQFEQIIELPNNTPLEVFQINGKSWVIIQQQQK